MWFMSDEDFNTLCEIRMKPSPSRADVDTLKRMVEKYFNIGVQSGTELTRRAFINNYKEEIH